MKSVYLNSFSNVLPSRVVPQGLLAEWVVEAHARYEDLKDGTCDKRRLKRFTLNESQISRRYMECPDEGTDWRTHSIYRLTEDSKNGSDILERNEFFQKRALSIFEESYRHSPIPDHLIHVTCTGYVAPSAPQIYFARIHKPPDITHAYHMGCYASLPAVRMANAFALAGTEKIDVFHTEMCSLHLNPSHHEPEQMVVQTLFADGHIRYQVNSEQNGFRIIAVKEKLLPDTEESMSWIPGPFGMSMTLSREVPNKIRDHIASFVAEMAMENNLDINDLIENGVFAIHPGGPRIIDVVQKKLGLREDQVSESQRVLFERGNMSSATLPHVWQEVLSKKYPRGTYIVSLAFGPGLTVFGSLFEVA